MKQNTSLQGPPSGEVRGRIDEEQHRRTISQGMATFVITTAVWLLTLTGILIAPWWAKIPLALVNGLFISIMFLAGHDAGHGVLLPVRWMNRLIGRISLLPALHPFVAWCHNHNALHHAFTNLREKDPGFPPLDLDEYRALPGWKKLLYRVGRTWYGLGVMYFTGMWLKWEMFPTAERTPRDRDGYKWDRILVVAFAVAWIGLLVTAAIVQGESILAMVLVGFVLPYAVWNWLIGFIIFQQHTHPKVPWYSQLDFPSPSYFQAQVRASPHLIFPAPLRFMMRHIMEHTAHHADPGVPLYHLEEAQKALERNYRRDIMRIAWSPSTLLETQRVCRLYDYDKHRWLDYDGTPLTEPLLPPRGSDDFTVALEPASQA